MADYSDVSVSSSSDCSDRSDRSDSARIKPIKIKVHSPAVKPKQEKMMSMITGSSITQIKSSPHISRASSSLSLASSSLTSVGVEDVRHLSNNYEQLLQQATASIKKLKKENQTMQRRLQP